MDLVGELAVDDDVPLIRLLEPHDQAQRRGLAGAGRTEHTEELAVADVEAQLVYRRDVAEALGDFVEYNVRRMFQPISVGDW